jgi:hypothetical protein
VESRLISSSVTTRTSGTMGGVRVRIGESASAPVRTGQFKLKTTARHESTINPAQSDAA